MAYYLYKKIRQKNKPVDPLALENTIAPLSVAQAETVKPDGDIEHETTLPEKQDEKSRPEEVADNPAEKRARRTYRWRVIGGMFFPMLVWSLMKTMIAAALPFIASDFEEFAQLNWIAAAPELTAAAFTPAWGQFADIFGRYSTLQASTLIMIFGSALCAGAPTSNFPMFLAGRGLQGMATSGMMILTRIVLSDKVTLKENAVNNTIFSAVSGVGFAIGPVVGGYLTSVTWRWCFILLIPLSVIGMVVVHFITRPVMLGAQDVQGQDGTTKVSRSATFFKRLQTVDFGGQILFLLGMGAFVLALTWAGAYYPWADVRVLAPLVVGSVLLLAFLLWEYMLLPGRVLARRFPLQIPMISLDLVWRRNAGLLMYINFITGMAMFSAYIFISLYFTIVERFESSKTGINLLFYLPGTAVGIYVAMFACNVWPRKTWYPLSLGTTVEALGITLIAASLHWGELPVIYGMLVVAGFGSGIRYMPNTLHSVGYFRQHIATVVSLMSLAVSLGGTLASTIMLNIFNNEMSSAGINLARGPASASSFSSINSLPAGEQAYVRRHAKDSIVIAFYGISSFMWLGVVAVMFLGNVNIRKSKSNDTRNSGQTPPEDLTRGAYIASWFRKSSRDNGDDA